MNQYINQEAKNHHVPIFFKRNHPHTILTSLLGQLSDHLIPRNNNKTPTRNIGG